MSDPSAPAITAAHLRLAPCPHCSQRRRALSEAGGRVLAICLGCRGELPEPFATERRRSRLVRAPGRALPLAATA